MARTSSTPMIRLAPQKTRGLIRVSSFMNRSLPQPSSAGYRTGPGPRPLYGMVAKSRSGTWRDPPDGVGQVVDDQQDGHLLIEGDADRTAPRPPGVGQKAGHEIDGFTGRLSGAERHPDDLVAGEILAVPAAVFPDEGSLRKSTTEAATGGEGQAKRSNVRAQGV